MNDQRTEQQEFEARDSDIAVIGLACRFPGADTPDAFWQVLSEGRETLTYFTDEELRAAGVGENLLNDDRYVKAGQVLADADTFDAGFFGITRDEAELIDPQQRQFLQCAHEALETAGYAPRRGEQQIGVYAGVGLNTYLLHNLGERYRTASSVDRYRMMITNDKDFVATRTSYKLNLRGPSVSTNTACSTSLVAVHLACLSLLSGDCAMAVAGAAHIQADQGEGYLHHEGMIFSPDGHCRAFDAKAQGTVIGNGVGAMVLKRLSDALADGDTVHAVIKGTAINNDGSDKTGYTAPSVQGQAAVIAEAQQIAEVAPETITYVEAHGTATPLGDPVEIAALNQAFGREGGTLAPRSCAIGSVKTNVGHLDTAAGMAGLIKTVLMLRHRTLVPSLHFESPNPEIDFAAGPFHVVTETRQWPEGATPRRAGVSSFGIGGTNAHVIVEEPPALPSAPDAEDAGPRLLVLSANTPAALDTVAAELARRLRKDRGLALSAVSQTLALGRRAHPYRRALVAADVRDAALALALGDADRILTADPTDERPVLDLAPGGAAPGHASALYEGTAAFREHYDRCAAELGTSADELLGARSPEADFAVQYATARTLAGWGITAPVVAADRTALPDAALRLLEGIGAQHAAGAGRPGIALLPQGPVPVGAEFLLALVGRLWTAGEDVDWAAFHEGERIRRVPLPTYPFERVRHWIEPHGGAAPAAEPAARTLRDRFAGATDAQKSALLTEFIRQEIAAVLGAPDPRTVDLDTNLFDMGLDSLILIEVIAKLSEELAHPVRSSAFVEYPTVRSFVADLSGELGIAPDTAAAAPAAASEGRVSRRAQRAAARRPGGTR
ncbi:MULTISPECIES: type I polyketide synthase [Streptomyces]|uniref:type I polyketide synthase n=1 Tax=Streptomyces TaxID=1883 RepID=UPI001E59DE91|nr:MULTISPECIES: beta-ketoacyl synthase N-terminal-like domain-containing protein [Streptomyces]UFQ19933.1 phosphopantetheine-binding protein [Streptomyces huasconensis]WCL89555.1 beta-ketoacyl synthase N-terminal-like domain-containing protein [Streptomyces sp. JCM 35825]